MMRILSMGAGVQTTALLLMDKYDLVVFADPGSEMPDTYQYIEKYLKPYCAENGMEWVTVRNDKETLEESIRRHNGPPDVRHRICTKDFKVRPIQNHMRRNYPVNKKNPYMLVMGISYDEAHRANYTQRYLYEKREFPLVDRKMSRQDCKDLIKRHGWPLPVKSGCDFCPFQKKTEWRRLRYEQPERFAELAQLEKGFVNGMTFSLSGKPLSKYLMDQSLDDFEEGCTEGVCMV